MTAEVWDPWNFPGRPASKLEGEDVVGFSVHATDGQIGHVHEATTELGASYIVIDTGPWNLGRKVMLPAGTTEDIDWDDEIVYVDVSMDEIKDAPHLTETYPIDHEYLVRLGAYYSGPGV